MCDYERELRDYWDQKTLQMGGMWWNYNGSHVLNGMINEWWILNIYWIMNEYERYDRLLRPENKPDGRDVIELESRECDEWND